MKKIGLILAVVGLALFMFTGRAMAVWDLNLYYYGDITTPDSNIGDLLSDWGYTYAFDPNVYDFVYVVKVTEDEGWPMDDFLVDNPYYFPVKITARPDSNWFQDPDPALGYTVAPSVEWSTSVLGSKIFEGNTGLFAFQVQDCVVGLVDWKGKDIVLGDGSSKFGGDEPKTYGPTPEPTSLLLLGGGLLGVALLGVARRRKITV